MIQGLEELRASLLREADEEAADQLDEAEAEARDIRAEAESEARQLRERAAQETERADEASRLRVTATASLERRRYLLTERQRLLDRVMASAAAALEATPEATKRLIYDRQMAAHDAGEIELGYAPSDEALVRELAAARSYKGRLTARTDEKAGLVFANGRIRDDERFQTQLAAREAELRKRAADILFTAQ